MKQRQLVNIAPFTTSSSGRTMKKSMAMPITCRDSNNQTTKKSPREERREVLKTQMRPDRNKVPKIEEVLMRIVFK